MTTAVLDPGPAIAEAVRDFLGAARELVSQDTDDPGVLDELSKLIGRTRRRITKATKASEAQPEPRPGTPTAAASATAMPTSRPAPAVAEPSRPVRPAVIPVPPPRVVTVPIPGATPQRREAPREQPTSPPGVPMATALAAPRSRWARRLVIGAVLVAVVIMLILLAGCGGTTATETRGTAAPRTSKGAPNAPTVSACRSLVTNEDIARMRRAISGTEEILFFQADKAAGAIYELRAPGGDVNVDPTVAAAMRAASEQAQAIRKKADYATNFDRQAWVAMITDVDVACKLAGVDMTAPR